MKDLILGVRHAREIGNAAPLRPYTKREHAPNLSGEAPEEYIRNGLVTFWHQSGTAKMGRDDMSVVDSRLKVYGVEGIRIADGSILPRVTTGRSMTWLSHSEERHARQGACFMGLRHARSHPQMRKR